MKLAMHTMQSEHIEQVLKIEQQSFATPWPQSLFEQELHSLHGNNYVAIISNGSCRTVAGYLCALTLFDECSIHKIACDTSWRRRGVGRELLDCLFCNNDCMKVKKYFLEVRESNTVAQHFYASLGFKHVSVRKDYYSDTPEDAVVMTLIRNY